MVWKKMLLASWTIFGTLILEYIIEIKTANQVAAQVAYLSTHLYASHMDLEKFKKMIGSMKIDKEGNVTIINDWISYICF